MSKGTDKKVNDQIQAILDQREEITRAFIAKHGYGPDKVKQVVNPQTGEWYLQKLSKKEFKNEIEIKAMRTLVGQCMEFMEEWVASVYKDQSSVRDRTRAFMAEYNG